jgi:hypothetical protein
MEIVGNGGPLSVSYEGGLQYNSDSSIQPYAAESDIGRLQLVNFNEHYACGEDLVLTAGVTYDGAFTFTEEGVVPSSCQPEAFWCSEQEFTPDNAAYLFFSAPTSFGQYPGMDSAGFPTPCGAYQGSTGCSVSRITAIAQPNENNKVGYLLDGSKFGVGSIASIDWLEVSYGDWASDCYPGTTLCTFFFPGDPSVNYGGPEYYPDSTRSQSFVLGIPGYGPYETYDDINMTASTSSEHPGAFTEPLPPIPCTLDGMNYCANISYENRLTEECTPDRKQPGEYPFEFIYWYQIFSSHIIVGIFSDTQIWSLNRSTCAPSQELSDTWSPSEPKVKYNDPNLP